MQERKQDSQLQIQIRNPWVEVRECWSQTTRWPFQLISQGFLLKFKGGPVSGVSCFVLTFHQYYAHETKGFSHFPLQHSPQLLCLSFWYGSCITIICGFWKRLVGGYNRSSQWLHITFFRENAHRIFEYIISCMIYKKFSAGKKHFTESSNVKR